jgi:hypothetical protein
LARGIDHDDDAGRASGSRHRESKVIIMSKHNKIVTVTVDTHAKQKLENAGNSVAELATAVLFGSDDRFGPKGARKQ